MPRTELIEQLAGKFPNLVFKDAEQSVTLILAAITNTLSQGDRVEIRGFGSFAVNMRKPRMARNPKTGESVQVPAKSVPHFKDGKELRERVDN